MAVDSVNCWQMGGNPMEIDRHHRHHRHLRQILDSKATRMQFVLESDLEQSFVLNFNVYTWMSNKTHRNLVVVVGTRNSWVESTEQIVLVLSMPIGLLALLVCHWPSNESIPTEIANKWYGGIEIIYVKNWFDIPWVDKNKSQTWFNNFVIGDPL